MREKKKSHRRSTARRARRSLCELYAEFNTRFWGGRLPSPISAVTKTYGCFGLPEAARGVVVRRTRVPFKQAATDLRTLVRVGRVSPPGKYWPARISVVNGNVPSRERQVLLHEMIHCHLHFSGRGPGHGSHFIAELERLASLSEGWAAREADKYRVEETS